MGDNPLATSNLLNGQPKRNDVARFMTKKIGVTRTIKKDYGSEGVKWFVKNVEKLLCPMRSFAASAARL